MKYKIVKFEDGNGESYFEIWTAKETMLSKIFGLRWRSKKELITGTPIFRDVQYNNLNQAQYALRGMKVKKEIIEEGELDDET